MQLSEPNGAIESSESSIEEENKSMAGMSILVRDPKTTKTAKIIKERIRFSQKKSLKLYSSDEEQDSYD